MEIIQQFSETLTKEWEKLPGFFKLATFLIALLELLVNFILKNEVLAVIQHRYTGQEDEILLLLIIIIIPLFSFLVAFLIVQLYKIQWNKEITINSDLFRVMTNTDLEVPEGYDMIKQISLSSFSLVFVVEDKQTKQRYLMKQLKTPPLLPSINIPSTQGIAFPVRRLEYNGNSYEVIRYYDGWTLAEIIELNRNNIGVCGALLTYWTKQLLDILVLLHLNSPPIIHRDINPSNILVNSDTLSLVLLDTSCAIPYLPDAKQTPLGTAVYSAPEQLEGRAVPASDIYSLGMTLYAINRCILPPLSSSRPYVHEKLKLHHAWLEMDQLFEACIQISPNERPENAQDAKYFLQREITKPEIFLGYLKLPSNDKISMSLLSWKRLERKKYWF